MVVEHCILKIDDIVARDIGVMAREGYDMLNIDTVNGLVHFSRTVTKIQEH